MQIPSFELDINEASLRLLELYFIIYFLRVVDQYFGIEGPVISEAGSGEEDLKDPLHHALYDDVPEGHLVLPRSEEGQLVVISPDHGELALEGNVGQEN